MPRRRRLAPRAYRAARTINDIATLASGNPRRIARRAKNKVLGRLLRPLFRALWGWL